MITHTGKIVKAGNGQVEVSIQTTAEDCSGCGIATLCSQKQTMTVPCDDADSSLVGRTVVIGTKDGVQRREALLFFVIPVLLLVGVLSLAISVGVKDGHAVIASQITVVLWYIIIYMLKARMHNRAEFSIIRFAD